MVCLTLLSSTFLSFVDASFILDVNTCGASDCNSNHESEQIEKPHAPGCTVKTSTISAFPLPFKFRLNFIHVPTSAIVLATYGTPIHRADIFAPLACHYVFLDTSQRPNNPKVEITITGIIFTRMARRINITSVLAIWNWELCI